MEFYAPNLFLLSLIFFSYLFFIFKYDRFPVINIYLGVNLIIFYTPAFLYLLFGLTHPSNKYIFTNTYNYTDLFFYGVILILTFDTIFLLVYLFLNNFNFNSKQIKLPNLNQLNYFHFYWVIFISVIIIDILSFITANKFMNSSSTECNPNLSSLLIINKYFENHSFLKNIKQIISEFSNMKFFLLITTGLIYYEYKTKKLLFLLLVILFYTLIIGVIIGSRFDIIIPFIFLIVIYFKQLLNFKKIILMGFLSFIGLLLFPIIGTIRIFFSKDHFNNCRELENKTEMIIKMINYNNINKLTDSGILNNIGDQLIQQSYLNKPFEIILSRLNYFDIVLKSLNFKINNSINNNFFYYYDNIYGLIPRIIYPNKRVINNNSDLLAVDLGIQIRPDNAIGLRPVAESFIYLGEFFIFVPIVLALIFFLIKNLYSAKNFLLKSASIYLGIMIIKRDSFHALIPGMFHEIIILIYLFINILIINFLFKKINYSRNTLS